MNTATRRLARYYAEQMASASKAAADYRKLARHAEELGMEYETERLYRTANEMDQEWEQLIEQAAGSGFTPEDIEAAS